MKNKNIKCYLLKDLLEEAKKFHDATDETAGLYAVREKMPRWKEWIALLCGIKPNFAVRLGKIEDGHFTMRQVWETKPDENL